VVTLIGMHSVGGRSPAGVGTVEHLLPRKWRANWLVTWSPNEAEMKAASRDRTLHELGNLTLVTQKLNSKVSNGSWATKVEHFQHIDDVLLTNDVIQSAPTNWDETEINARTATLAASILKVGPVPVGHIGLATQPTQPEPPGEVDLALLVSEGPYSAGNRARSSSRCPEWCDCRGWARRARFRRRRRL
jgi:hypothetical protein